MQTYALRKKEAPKTAVTTIGKNTTNPLQRRAVDKDEAAVQMKQTPLPLQTGLEDEEDERLQMKGEGIPVNDDLGLEDEADIKGGHALQRVEMPDEEDDTLQLKTKSQNRLQLDQPVNSLLRLKEETAVLQPKQNNTGLPDNLKTGVEVLSGYSMDDVKVHYNSTKPTQLQALAYAQGTDIHVAPGQEQYLPHEAWHVVQQKQGRVQPTMQMKGTVAINDDKELESEADVMGLKATQLKLNPSHINSRVIQRTVESAAAALFQMGIVTVKGKDIKGAFGKHHEIAQKDIKPIQEELNKLRANNPSAKKEVIDMSNQTNWPTSGGMNETDAKDVAKSLGWTEDTTTWTCRDKSHTPKGKVYTNRGIYYGADNTGHVGWGFKVWEINKGKELDYRGNISWDGSTWNHDPRGTK